MSLPPPVHSAAARIELPSTLRRRLALGLTVMPAACSIGGTPAPTQPITLPSVRIGDRWRYQVIDRFRNDQVDRVTHEVAQIAPEIVIRVTDSRSSRVREDVFSSPWSAIAESVYDLPVRFNRPMPILPVPIEAGETLQSSATYRSPGTEGSMRWVQHLRAERWVQLDLPAGRFDCLRIGRVISFDHPDSSRTGSSRTDTIWYSPQANRWVQREWSGEYTSRGFTGAPEGLVAREDWLLWQLLEYRPAPRG